MTINHPLKRAISIVGLRKLARGLNLTHQAVLKWQRAGRMPRSEWTGETTYSETIAAMCDQQVTKEQLLSKWPVEEVGQAVDNKERLVQLMRQYSEGMAALDELKAQIERLSQNHEKN